MHQLCSLYCPEGLLSPSTGRLDKVDKQQGQCLLEGRQSPCGGMGTRNASFDFCEC